MTDYILTTDRLGLRHWKDSDIEPFAAMNMDNDVMRFFLSLYLIQKLRVL